MTQTALSKAAERLLTAEKRYHEMKAYWDELPADQNYDLGVRMTWNWGSSNTGYDEVQRAVQQGLNRGLRAVQQGLNRSLRLMINSAVEEAKIEMELAEQALRDAARGVVKVGSSRP